MVTIKLIFLIDNEHFDMLYVKLQILYKKQQLQITINCKPNFQRKISSQLEVIFDNFRNSKPKRRRQFHFKKT